MALRRVFAQDADFKESMFARQIAVMKGQAWNVVETLKQNDHGPLELTRRTRVCVWDDLVDVPVAIPMRVPSSEMSRRKARMDHPEEIDIGASYASAPGPTAPPYDLLGSPTSELPNPNRFELTRDDSAADLSNIGEEGHLSPIMSAGVDFIDFAETHAQAARSNLSHSVLPPSRLGTRGKARLSFEFPRSTPKGGGRRQRSMSTRSGKNRPPPTLIYEGDDLEGDLGYAAASDMEHHQRKVIVERLETVKSKKPFFTWC